MNIIVRTSSGSCIIRPDTTWEKDNEDFFPPEFVTGLAYAPVLFARICRPGRSVAAKFASRYYDAINYGVLLYPENFLDGSETGFACASCLDHTSFLPSPLFNRMTLGQQDNDFTLSAGDRCIFSYNAGTAAMIEQAIEAATRCIYIRTGDIIAIELQPREHLWSREEGDLVMRGTFCDNETMQFKVIV